MSQIRRPPTQILTGDSMPMSLAIVKVARHKTTCDSASVYTSVVWRIHASRWCVLFLSGRFMKILKSEFLKMYQKIKSFRLTHLIRDVDLRCNICYTQSSATFVRGFLIGRFFSVHATGIMAERITDVYKQIKKARRCHKEVKSNWIFSCNSFSFLK